MLLTGTTLLQVLHAVAKPTKKVADGLNTAKEAAMERREEKRAAKEAARDSEDFYSVTGKEDDIDIVLDGEDRALQQRQRTREKLNNLKRAFTEPYEEEVWPEPGIDVEPAVTATKEKPTKPQVQEVSLSDTGEVDVLDIP